MDFSKAGHTIVLSDVHLSEAELPKIGNPLWKKFKRSRYFIDQGFSRLLTHLQRKIGDNFELVLNGDIFDFDSVMAFPTRPKFNIGWLERLRGLNSEEEKSRFKIRTILSDHPVFVQALRKFILDGNRVIFVIGNHDIEMYWDSVQKDIRDAIGLPEDKQEGLRFCEWFYLSNQDTLIEHGNQYDDYCLCQNPLHPLVRKGGKYLVRIPFGNAAGKYILNGMGMMNPHVDSTFIKSSFTEYVVFFFKYVLRYEPFLIWSWFWGAMATLLSSLTDGVLPALKDPLTVEHRVKDVADRANASPEIVRSLRELHVHPAIFNPLRIMQELWLDRALLFLLIVTASFQVFSLVNVFVHISMWWMTIPLLLGMPAFLFYARSVQSDIFKIERTLVEHAPLAAKIVKVRRVIMGHTHREFHTHVQDVELINTGTWSPAFEDPECLKKYGRTCFAWIRPDENQRRTCTLYEWQDPDCAIIAPEIFQFQKNYGVST